AHRVAGLSASARVVAPQESIDGLARRRDRVRHARARVAILRARAALVALTAVVRIRLRVRAERPAVALCAAVDVAERLSRRAGRKAFRLLARPSVGARDVAVAAVLDVRLDARAEEPAVAAQFLRARARRDARAGVAEII